MLDLLDEPMDLKWVPVFFQIPPLRPLVAKQDNMHGAARDTTWQVTRADDDDRRILAIAKRDIDSGSRPLGQY